MPGISSHSLLLLKAFSRAMRWVLWLLIAAWLVFLGAMAALFAYPLLLEPFLSISAQSSAWCGLYAVYAALHLACLPGGSAAAPSAADPEEAIGVRRRAQWLLLSAAPCAASPGCSPSRASLLTGRHTWQIEQAGTHDSNFPTNYVVFPDLLEANGYAVGFTGKGWGPGNWPCHREHT